MGYLDYINKKHSRERRMQIMRNKVSGFVLLTIVFLLIFGLSLVMTFFLARAFTKMLKKAATTDNNNDDYSFILNSTNLPSLNANGGGDQLVPSILMSETMVTASPSRRRGNMTVDYVNMEQIMRAIKLTLREQIKKTNITRWALEKLSPHLAKMIGTTIAESIRLTQIESGDGRVNKETVEPPNADETDEHYLDFIDEFN